MRKEIHYEVAKTLKIINSKTPLLLHHAVRPLLNPLAKSSSTLGGGCVNSARIEKGEVCENIDKKDTLEHNTNIHLNVNKIFKELPSIIQYPGNFCKVGGKAFACFFAPPLGLSLGD